MTPTDSIGHSPHPGTAAQAGATLPLDEAAERNRLILASVRDYAIFTSGSDGRIQTWEPGAEAVYGWTAAEAIGQDVAVIFTSEDHETGTPGLEQDIALRDGYTPNIRWHVRNDGCRVFIQGSVQRILASRPGAHALLWIGQDVTKRQQWEERQGALVAELQHRTRNLMSIVLSIADKTLRRSAALPDFRSRFLDRLEALARVQGLLSRLDGYDRVTFGDLIRTELHAIDGVDDRVTLTGPADIKLRSSTVQTFAMALHELATNAVKYGALGQPSGRLAVTWSLEAPDADGRPCLHVDWRETGVDMRPQNPAPPGTGQGRELIERALPYQLGAKTSYQLTPDGVHCTISVPVSAHTGKVADND